MIDRIYLPVRCPGCSKMSVTSLSIDAMKSAFEGERPVLLTCAFDCREWLATADDRARIQRLLAENAMVAGLPWFKLRDAPASPYRYF